MLRASSLDARRRELLILRVGWHCKSGYEFNQHSRLALQAGMTPDEIERIKHDPTSDKWSDQDRTLLRAADELLENHFISDDTWARLGGFLSDEERMDVVYVVGHYTQVCMILNTFGIQLEDGRTLDEELRA